MDKFLETYELPQQNQEDVKTLNRPKIFNEIEAVIISETDSSRNFSRTFREKIISSIPQSIY